MIQAWYFLHPVYEAGRHAVGLVRLEKVKAREPNIPGDWPSKPFAVVLFEKQEDESSLLDCQAGAEYMVVISYAEHGDYLLPVY